jgi:hypothetical protein
MIFTFNSPWNSALLALFIFGISGWIFYDHCRISKIWINSAKEHIKDTQNTLWLCRVLFFTSAISGYVIADLSTLAQNYSLYLQLGILIGMKLFGEKIIREAGFLAYSANRKNHKNKDLFSIKKQVKNGLLSLQEAEQFYQEQLESLRAFADPQD